MKVGALWREEGVSGVVPRWVRRVSDGFRFGSRRKFAVRVYLMIAAGVFALGLALVMYGAVRMGTSVGTVGQSHVIIHSSKGIPRRRHPAPKVHHRSKWNSLMVGTPREMTYERVGGYRGTMFLFLPKLRRPQRVPIVVYFHGGSLIHGSAVIGAGQRYRKDWVIAEIERQVVEHGFAFASVNYRLAPKYKWPAQIDDATASIRFLKARASTLGIDPSEISVMGDSAGGALASLVGVTSVSDRHGGPFASGPFRKESSNVRAVVDMFGPVDRRYYAANWVTHHGIQATPAFGVITPKLVHSASAVSYVRRGDPHFLIVQGLQDPVDPPSLSMEMYNKLRDNGDSAQLILIQHASHEFIPKGGTLSPRPGRIARDIAKFLEENGRFISRPTRIALDKSYHIVRS